MGNHLTWLLQGISSFSTCLLFASSISSTPTGYGHKPAPCTTQLVSLPSHTCKVEYDKTCIVRPKAVEHVSGYAKGECKQVVKEKCYRRVRGRKILLSPMTIMFTCFSNS